MSPVVETSDLSKPIVSPASKLLSLASDSLGLWISSRAAALLCSCCAGAPFRRAAARLYISQPALSNQILTLERTLALTCSCAPAARSSFTAAGRRSWGGAAGARPALERAAERARLAGAGIAGTVRLGYAPMAWLRDSPAPIVTAVEQDSPNVTSSRPSFQRRDSRPRAGRRARHRPRPVSRAHAGSTQ